MQHWLVLGAHVEPELRKQERPSVGVFGASRRSHFRRVCLNANNMAQHLTPREEQREAPPGSWDRKRGSRLLTTTSQPEGKCGSVWGFTSSMRPTDLRACRSSVAAKKT